MYLTWLDSPSSPAWQAAHSVISIVSLYRTAAIGIQDPNKDPSAKSQHKESTFVIVTIVLLPRVLQVYSGLTIVFHLVRVVMALGWPQDLHLFCRYTPPMWLTLAGIAGALVGWAGTELRLRCYKTLGKYFTFRLAVQEDQPLITTGPYKYLRHPAYLGGLLQGLGMELSLTLCNPISLYWGRGLFPYAKELEIALLALGFFPPIAALLKRMWEEEKMMKAKYGKEYAEWQRTTPWRIIPYVY